MSVIELLNSNIFYLAFNNVRDDLKYSLLILGAEFSDIIQRFMCCLWFVSDNSVNLKSCYIRVLQGGKPSDEMFFLRPAYLFTSCNCEALEVRFSFDELEKAQEI